MPAPRRLARTAAALTLALTPLALAAPAQADPHHGHMRCTWVMHHHRARVCR